MNKKEYKQLKQELEANNPTPSLTGWEDIDERLSVWHTRFCPLVESEDKYGRKQCLENREELKSFIKSLLEAQTSSFRKMVEDMKGWPNCIKGDVSHGKCPGCAERTGYNKALSDLLESLK